MMASRHRSALGLIVGAVIVSVGLSVQAQRNQRGQDRSERFQTGGQLEGNVPYDAQFTFVRIMYRSYSRGGCCWYHDYPRGERHFMKILNAVSLLNPHMEESNVMTLDDPELFKFPVAYMAEPGFWQMSEAELAGLKAYIAKGGFLIFDDFQGQHWYNFEAQMNRVFPRAVWQEMTADHPIFHSFYDIKKLDIPHPIVNVIPDYYALFENNDPNGRMLALANHNNDIAEYWEWSAEGLYSLDWTGDAYRLGVNFFIYALTH